MMILCPQCDNPLSKDARTCPKCGVDLVLFALLAERAYLEGLPQSAPIASTPDALVPRIGEYLLEQGLLTEEKLEAALQRQEKQASTGKKLLLGQTLVQMGFVDRETLDRAITRQIIELHAALQETNRTLERRVAERTIELRRALERLTDLTQLKANLVSNISHELRTPLAHIKGYVELLAETQMGSLNEEQLRALDVILRASNRLEGLIEDLIEFSTASREGLQLDIQSMDAAHLIQDALQRSEEKAERAGVKLLCELGEDLPPLLGDAEKLSWVLYQLVDNGIKFTPAGGWVKIRASHSEDHIDLAVQDAGIGIPPERLQEIFEPFHQLDGSPTRRYGGTGLGLSLVRLILNAHGSKIEVESLEDNGSSFTFRLPVGDAEL